MTSEESTLVGRVVAIPENRQLTLLTQILEKRGARVVSVPMMTILDAPDPEPILKWIEDFISSPPDILVLLTGEGLRRLLSLAESNGIKAAFIDALTKVSSLCRGPKPNRVLRELGLNRDLDARSPTTDGVIATLDQLELSGKVLAVQLYGEEPNLKLISYIQARGAIVKAVAPYIYATKLEEEKVIKLIQQMESGEIDVIAFTSQPQVKRLLQVVKSRSLEQNLLKGLEKTRVAAVGPVVKELLLENGINVEIMPERTYFMKPMVKAITKYLDTMS